MADIVSPETRRRMMQNIRGKDTKPELLLRSGLHRMGYRFRLHDKQLPGKPDLVFPKYRAVLFVHGCFWHGHGCHLFKWPKTREKFWYEKINRNRNTDEANMKLLREAGWRICIVWECSMKGKYRFESGQVLEMVSDWLRSNDSFTEISSRIGSFAENTGESRQ